MYSLLFGRGAGRTSIASHKKKKIARKKGHLKEISPRFRFTVVNLDPLRMRSITT